MSKPLACGALVPILFAALSNRAALASSVVVPDDFPTVQLAIDSGADTVLIREGTYPDRPVVDHAVVLQGIGSQRPRLAGLDIFNSYFWAIPPLLSVNRIDFSGRVEHTTLYYRPRNLLFSFSDCSLDSGFYQVASLDPYDVASLTFNRCHLGGQSSARIAQEFMDADTIDGGVSWNTQADLIHDCWFTGGPGTAIDLTSRPTGTIAANRIEGYTTGIRIHDADQLLIEHNSISRCGTAVGFGASTGVEIRDNDIRGGGIGITFGGVDGSFVRDNRITDGRNEGILGVDFNSIVAERNVVYHCGAAGISLNWNAFADYVNVLGNTLVGNGGDGVEMIRPPDGYPRVVVVENNIAYGNGGWGLAFSGGGPVQIGCNDWFDNPLGSVTGTAVGSTDLFLDPSFCDVAGGDVSLDAASPLVGVSACGQIGALGVGCAVTATLVRRFVAERTDDGVRVAWELGGGLGSSEVVLERRDPIEGEAWIRPATERSVEGLAVVELDRGTVPERAYWYRLVALDGNHPVVIAPPIEVESQVDAEFQLMEVAPNPSAGAVRIGFALRYAAAVAIDIFDLQGRRVASPGRGVWGVGKHAVEWDGRTRSAEVLPPGLYLLRYSYPGGQDRRTIVRVR